MCEHGDEVLMRVLVDARDSHTGEARYAEKGIDRCIAPLVKALNDAAIITRSSCCGHGKEPGTVMLADGRTVRVYSVECPDETERMRLTIVQQLERIAQLNDALAGFVAPSAGRES